MNPNFEDIGREFVKQYYILFDNQETRPSLSMFYSPDNSLLTFEGKRLQGVANIMEKFDSLGFKTINRIITKVDSQPLMDGGVLISVLGRLQCDDDPAHEFTQIFVLQVFQGSFVLMHDIFRLGLHDLDDTPKLTCGPPSELLW